MSAHRPLMVRFRPGRTAVIALCVWIIFAHSLSSDAGGAEGGDDLPAFAVKGVSALSYLVCRHHVLAHKFFRRHQGFVLGARNGDCRFWHDVWVTVIVIFHGISSNGGSGSGSQWVGSRPSLFSVAGHRQSLAYF